MTNTNTGLSAGADPGLLAGFLTGEILRDYQDSIRDVVDAAGLDLKGQPKGNDENSGAGNCSCDATNCRNTCVTPDASQHPKCDTHHQGCPPPKPPKGPTKRASW
jgi:hypothetical protein